MKKQIKQKDHKCIKCGSPAFEVEHKDMIDNSFHVVCSVCKLDMPIDKFELITQATELYKNTLIEIKFKAEAENMFKIFNDKDLKKPAIFLGIEEAMRKIANIYYLRGFKEGRMYEVKKFKIIRDQLKHKVTTALDTDVEVE